MLVTGANKGHRILHGRPARRSRRPRGAQRAQRRPARGGGGRHPRSAALGIRRDPRPRHVVARLGAGGRRCALVAGPPLDGVVANAGMVHTPSERRESVDGNELVLATNMLGHFALLARLTAAARAGRAHRVARVAVDDALDVPHRRPAAHPRLRFLACLRAVEDRVAGGRVRARPPVESGGCPGVEHRRPPRLLHRRANAAGAGRACAEQRASASPTRCRRSWAQGKHRGAEPILHALTAPGVEGGQFWGPRFMTKGSPVLHRPTRTTTDPSIASPVWSFAEHATDTEFVVAR